MTESTNPYEYFAFISYKREDEKWAKWLQHKLEYYKLPTSVRKDNPDLPDKIRPVFKDTTDLEPGVLAQKIQNALDSSKFLIVICSPRSANSVWVSKEVQSFIDSGRADHIIPFIIGGTPNASDPKDECYPEGLRQLAGDQELLGANINEMGRDAAAIKVVARMFNLRFDTLWQRFERGRKKKNMTIIALALMSILVAFSLGILYIDRNNAYSMLSESNKSLEITIRELSVSKDSIRDGNEMLRLTNDSLDRTNDELKKILSELNLTNNFLAQEKENVTRINWELLKKHAKSVANIATAEIEKGNLEQSILSLLTVIPSDGKMPYVPEVEAALRVAFEKYNSGNWFYSIMDGYYYSMEKSENGEYIMCINDNNIDTFDFDTYSRVITSKLPNPNAVKISFIEFLNQPEIEIIAISENAKYALLQNIESLTEDDGEFYSYSLWSNMGKEIFKIDNSGIFYNSRIGYDEITYVSFSPDEKKIALSFMNGLLEIYSCETGDLLNTWKCDFCDHYSNWNKFGNNSLILHSSRFESGVKIYDVTSSQKIDSIPSVIGGEIFNAISNYTLDRVWTIEENLPIVNIKSKMLEPSKKYEGFKYTQMNPLQKLTTADGKTIYVKNEMIECIDSNNIKCWGYESNYGCILYNLYDNNRLVIIGDGQRFNQACSFIDVQTGEVVYRIPDFSDVFTDKSNDTYIFSQTNYVAEENKAFIVLPYIQLIKRCSDIVKGQSITNITKKKFNL